MRMSMRVGWTEKETFTKLTNAPVALRVLLLFAANATRGISAKLLSDGGTMSLASLVKRPCCDLVRVWPPPALLPAVCLGRLATCSSACCLICSTWAWWPKDFKWSIVKNASKCCVAMARYFSEFHTCAERKLMALCRSSLLIASSSMVLHTKRNGSSLQNKKR